MSGLAGTGTLVRLALRRERVVLPAWILVLVATAASSAAATIGLYPTVASRVQAAGALNGSPVLVALYGRVYDPTSLGAIAMLKMSGFGGALVAVLAVVTVVRHTRADEEAGRLELVGGAAVGRLAPLAAALLVAAVANLGLGLGTGVALAAAGLPAAGSYAFGLSWAGIGLAFAAVAAVAGQLTTAARAATGLGMGTVAVVYVLRAVGDLSDGTARWLTWASPIGWAQQVRPYAGERWWVLSVSAAFSLVVGAVAFLLVRSRDLGAGAIPIRPGPGEAGPALGGPFALAWRLHRGVFLAWTAGVVILAPVLGIVVSDLGDFFDSPSARAVISRLGGSDVLIDAFLAAEVGVAGIVVSAFAVAAVLRARTEETSGRAEPVLAAATSRIRWAAGHLAVAFAGSAFLLALFGAGAGLAHGLKVGDPGELGRVLGAALAQLPAVWVLAGLATAVVGIVPRAAGAAWAALVAILVLGEVGPLLELDPRLLDLSPFAHVPRLPGGDWSPTPLLALTGVAGVLTLLGLAGLRRRDIG